MEKEPNRDERDGMAWWNSMTEAERAQALANAGWKAGATWTPSPADAWADHKKRTGLEVQSMSETVHVEMDLSDAKAQALAQLVKRLTWSAMRECSVDEAECYEIRAAVDILQRALAEAGYQPR